MLKIFPENFQNNIIFTCFKCQTWCMQTIDSSLTKTKQKKENVFNNNYETF